MLYAVKLGPIETESDGDCYAYIGFAEELAMPPIMAKRDAEGLRELAEQSHGHELRCEANLSKAGKKLGFVPGQDTRRVPMTSRWTRHELPPDWNDCTRGTEVLHD